MIKTLSHYLAKRLAEKSTFAGLGAACGSVIAVVPAYAQYLGAVMLVCGVIVTLLPSRTLALGTSPDA